MNVFGYIFHFCRRSAQPKGQFSVTQRTYGIKVNHLPNGITDSQVTHIFQQYGSIGNVCIKEGENECYAFVNFHSKSCAQTAAEKANGMIVGGKAISIRVQSHTVKVSYLSKQTTEASLTNHFSLGDSAKINSVNLIDCGSNSPYNYAYINYTSRRDAAMAEKNLNHTHLEGTSVRVKYVGTADAKSVTPPQKPETPLKSYPSAMSYPQKSCSNIPQSAHVPQVHPVTSSHAVPLSGPRAPHVPQVHPVTSPYAVPLSGPRAPPVPQVHPVTSPYAVPLSGPRVPPVPQVHPVTSPYAVPLSGPRAPPVPQVHPVTSPYAVPLSGPRVPPVPQVHPVTSPYAVPLSGPRAPPVPQVHPVTSPYAVPLSRPRVPPVYGGPVLGRSHSVSPSPYIPQRSAPASIHRQASQPLQMRPKRAMVSQSCTIKVSIYGELSSEDIEEVFSQFGKVREKPIVRSGTPKFCYVNFESPEMASKSCDLNNTRVKGVRVEVKLSQKQRAASLSNQKSQMISCSSLIVSILQVQHKLEELETEHRVSLKPSPKCIKMWGEADKLATAEASLQVLIKRLEEEVSNEDCELPCHSLPLFEQSLAVTQLHKIEETHRVEFRILSSTHSSLPLDLDSFKGEVTKHFSNSGSSSMQTDVIPKCSNFTSFLTQKPQTPSGPSAEHVWLWQNDDGTGYTPYTTDVCARLNHSFSTTPQSSLFFTVGNFMYEIDFSTMTQTNTSSGRERPVKRVAKNTLNVEWYFQDDNSQYSPYTREESAEIERMFRLNASQLLTIKGRSYTFDFIAMIQTNAHTKHSRRIRRQVTVSQSQTHPNTEQVLVVQVWGLPSSLHPAMKELQSTVSSATVEKQCRLHASCSEDFKSRLLQNMSEYLITPSLAEHYLTLQGMPQYVEKVALIAEQEKNLEYEQQLQASKGVGGNAYEVPKEWVPQSGNYMLSRVASHSAEWDKAVKPFLKTLPTTKVTRVERIQNKWLWERYCFAKNRMSMANKGCINEEHLFHGTRGTPPEKVIKSEKGIDFRYSGKGLWGEGSYFAVNASYSDNYSHSLPGAQGKQMLICKVLTGECCDYGRKNDPSLRQPPMKSSSGTGAFEEERYDSVKGYTNGSHVYVVYDHEKVYPAYIITYHNT